MLWLFSWRSIVLLDCVGQFGNAMQEGLLFAIRQWLDFRGFLHSQRDVTFGSNASKTTINEHLKVGGLIINW